MRARLLPAFIAALAVLAPGGSAKASQDASPAGAQVAPVPVASDWAQACARATEAESAGRLEEALGHAEAAIGLEGAKLEGHVLKAFVLARLQRFDEARAALAAAHALANDEQALGLKSMEATIELLAKQGAASTKSKPSLSPESAALWAKLQAIVEQADKAELIEDRARLLWSFLKQSEELVAQAPTFAPVQVVRCMAAVEVDSPSIGWTAFLRLKQLGLVEDPPRDALFARLQLEAARRGWDGQLRASRPWGQWTKDSVLEAAAFGDPEALEAVGTWYDLGQCDLPKSAEEAEKHLRLAAEAGLPTAQFRMGLRTRDTEAAKGWHRRAAFQGDPSAQAVLGDLLASDPRADAKAKAEAVGWWRMAALGGETRVRGRLARAYFLGEGVAREPAIAVELWRLADKDGDSAATRMLGICALTGEGMQYDAPSGAYLLGKAAERGDAEAQYMLGLCHLAGHGVEVDKELARQWIEQAALQGSARAKEQLERLGVLEWGFAARK